MATRVGAMAAATTVGAVEGGFIAAVSPVSGAAEGALSVLKTGRKLSIPCAKPATAVVGMAFGTVKGTVGGVFAAIVAPPMTVALKGSYTRKTDRFLDQYVKGGGRQL